MTTLWALVVFSSGNVLFDHIYFEHYERCLKAKKRIEMVGELHWRKKALCEERKIDVEKITN